MNKKKTVVHWFRKGLRIHDNPALNEACQKCITDPVNYVLRPIFILDPEILQWMVVGANRFRFLQESLKQLNDNLIAINTRLYVIRGNPMAVFSRIITEWNIDTITFEIDIEPYAKKRDAAIELLAAAKNITIQKHYSHTIYNPTIVLKKNMNKPPLTYQSFLGIVEKLTIPKPVEAPTKIPLSIMPTLDSLESKDKTCYNVPDLSELISDLTLVGPNKYPGGESEAIKRMKKYLSQKEWICTFEKPLTSPNSIEPSTTVLSPYIKFGCLSSRLFLKKLNEILAKHPKHSKPPVSLLGQLMWREFYYTAAASEPNFDRMIGNSICYQIPWKKNDEYLKAWTYGKTGYPFIDAIMRQLRQEGWIHHLARHAVACFLTRGDLWISWEEGQKVFEELLLDADWALNAGNWMWLSASAFFYQYFRVYSPVAFGKKTDKQGTYIKKYIPELKNYPSGIIYEPWKASKKDQEIYGCIIGQDYPKRIIKHEEIYKINISKMTEAYKKNREMKSKSNTDISQKEKFSRKVSEGQSMQKTKKRKISSTLDKFIEKN